MEALGRVRQMLSPNRKRLLDKEEKLDVLSTSTSAEDYGCEECTSNNISELQSVFNYFDEDGDGKISAAELQSCLKTVGGQLSTNEAETVVKSSDLNGDGLLDYHEFHKLMDSSSGSDEELKQAFGIYDVEGSGCITPAGLKRMLSRLGDSRSLKECKAMIQAFDLNGDGVLSFDEFLLMMR